MIYLEQGQNVAENEDLVVYDATGDYNDADMVICAKRETPFEPYCRFEAQFIAYGGVVYAINDEKKLLEEIQKVDPDTAIAEETTDSMIDQQEDLDTRPKEEKIPEPEAEPTPDPEPISEPDPVSDEPAPESAEPDTIINEPAPEDPAPVPTEEIPAPEPVPDPEPGSTVSDSAGGGAELTGDVQ
jgi:outer membrane biosynthesis protein TonB